MSNERIQPAGLPNPPTYAQVIKAGNTVYIAGQVANDESDRLIGPGDFTAQATQVFENLRKCLTAAGTDFDHVVKITVYLADPRYREPLAAVREKYFTGPLPTSTLVTIAALAKPEYLLEIEAIAVLD